MSTAVGIDTDLVAEWIVGLDIGAVAPLSFSRIGNGQSNLTYRVGDVDGRNWVLRRPPLGALLASAHDVLREHRIMSALQDTPVPVPKMIATTNNPAVTDAPLVLMGYIDGVVVDDVAVASELSPERRRAIGLSLPRALGTVHSRRFGEQEAVCGPATQALDGAMGTLQDPGHRRDHRGRASAGRPRPCSVRGDTGARRLLHEQRDHRSRQR